MTPAEFKAKFKVGDRITGPIWGTQVGTITGIGNTRFFYEYRPCEENWSWMDWDWKLYEEPKPVFDPGADILWGVHKQGSSVRAFEKIAKYSYVCFTGNSSWVGCYTFGEIKNHFDPCARPAEWWRWFGLEEEPACNIE